MKKTLEKLEDGLKAMNIYQLIEFEKNFFFKGLFIDDIVDLDLNNIDTFYTTFAQILHNVIKEKLSSVKENFYDLFIYCVKLYEYNRCVKTLEMISSLRILVKQLTKDEVFKLLSNDCFIDEKTGIFSNEHVKNFLKIYSI